MTTRNGWDKFADIIGRDGVVDNWEESAFRVKNGVTRCRHCHDSVTDDPNEAEECWAEWNDAPAPGEYCHVSSGGVWCDTMGGTRAEPDKRISSQEGETT